MKRPSFQFYPGDWTSDLKLRRCSPAARGVWMDIICALHDSDDGYGLLRWPLKEISSTVGASLAHVRELVEKGVLRGADSAINEPLVYTPRSGRKLGTPVTLIDTQPGPLWYSKRMVVDAHVRTTSGASSRFQAGEGNDEEATKPRRKPPPTPSPSQRQGEDQSDGSSTSSPSSASPKEKSERSADSTAAARAFEPGEPEPRPPPTPAGRACLAMRAVGMAAVNPGDPRLLALVEQGATVDEFAGIAAEAVRGSKGFAWVLVTLEARRREAAAITLAPRPQDAPDAWQSDRNEVIRRGCELGLGPFDASAAATGDGEGWSAYRRRVVAASDSRTREPA